MREELKTKKLKETKRLPASFKESTVWEAGLEITWSLIRVGTDALSLKMNTGSQMDGKRW